MIFMKKKIFLGCFTRQQCGLFKKSDPNPTDTTKCANSPMLDIPICSKFPGEVKNSKICLNFGNDLKKNWTKMGEKIHCGTTTKRLLQFD
jgi:hypothetical protein